MRLAFATFVLRHRVDVYAKPLGHLVLIEIQLLASDQQLFSECQFSHEVLPVVSGQRWVDSQPTANGSRPVEKPIGQESKTVHSSLSTVQIGSASCRDRV